MPHSSVGCILKADKARQNKLGFLGCAAIFGKECAVRQFLTGASLLQVIEDLREECSKYGQVMKVVVPRPPVPQQAHALFNQQNYGKVNCSITCSTAMSSLSSESV